MRLPNSTAQNWTIYPEGLPKALINTLIIACLLLGLAGLRAGRNLQGWLAVLDNWCFMLLWIPTAITICAVPLRVRDSSFELKKVYYFGIFVAFLFILNKLRYMH